MKHLFIIIIVFSYSCENKSNLGKIIERSETPANWKRIEVSNFAFSIPNSLQKIEANPVDTLAFKFSNGKISFFVEDEQINQSLKELANSSNIKNYEKTEHKEENLDIVQVSYQYIEGKERFEDKDKSYAKAISYNCKGTKGVNFLILLKNLNDRETADQIINSISVNCSKNN